MAKKKAASAVTSTATAPKKAPAKSAASKTTSNGDSSTAAAVLGTDQIGMAAGAVWSYLSDNGETTVTALKKAIGSADLVLAAIGWLAREEKLDFTVSGKTVKVALK